jgi:hypothetical protein
MKKWLAQLKEYWFLVVFIMGGTTAVASLVAGNYVAGIARATVRNDASQLYIQDLIAAELARANVPSDATVEKIHGHLATHDSEIEGLGTQQALTAQQLQDVARILMQPPGGQ